MSKNLLSIILMVASFIRAGTSSIMSYTTISVLLLFISVLYVYRSIVCQKRLYLILAGLFIGISVFFRLPNILFASLYMVVLWSNIIYDRRDRIIRDTLYMLAGAVIGIVLTVPVLIYNIGIDGIISSGSNYVSIASSPTNNHGIAFMIFNLSRHFINGIRMHIFYGLFTSVFAVALFCIISVNAKKGVKSFPLTATAILMCSFLVAFFITIFKYSQYTSVTLILASISIPVQLFSVFYFMRKQKMLSILSLATLCISFSISLGTDNGLYHQLYTLFWLLPYYVYVAQQLSIDLFNKITSPNRGGTVLALALSVFVIMSINAFTSVSVNSIRTAIGVKQYREQEINNLNYFPKSCELLGIATSESQGIFLDEVNSFFDNEKYAEYSVLAVNDIPMVFSVIDNRPAISKNYWIDLRSVPISRITDALDKYTDNEKRPIVIVKYLTYNDTPFTVSEKAAIIQKYCEKHNYIEEKTGMYNNEKLYSIFIPEDKTF